MALTLALLLGGISNAEANETYPVGPSGAFTLQGHGYGHGIGMSQWGAYGAATQGLNALQILQFYYPGTVLTGQPDSYITVRLSTGRSGEVVVDAGPGLALIWQDGSLPLPAKAPNGAAIQSWRLIRGSGGLLLDYVDTSAAVWRRYSTVPGNFGNFTSNVGTVRLVEPGFQRREYRGAVGALWTSGGLLTVNTVPMESYLRSVVPAEMPSSWPFMALAAQAVAARTYASHQRYNATGPTHTCDTTACQVYAGVARYSISGALLTRYESATTTNAIMGTANQVLITGGAFSYAFTQFSSSNGGWTRQGSKPYLTARYDPYDGAIPSSAHSWSATVSATSVRTAYPGVGMPVRLTVLARDGKGEWNGRVTSVRIEGTSGSIVVTGDALRSALGLRSTWWTTGEATQTSGGQLADVTGDGFPDAFARVASSGALWFYPGTRGGAFNAPKSVGTGWGILNWIGSPGDVTGDGIPDLYGRESTSGVLWLYPISRNGVAAGRRAVGSGWNTLDLVVTPGDVTGDGIPDLYGRNSISGNLQFYAGITGGSFAPPVTVNAGWHSVDVVVGVGDVTKDGVPDLIARDQSGGTLTLYPLARSGAVLPGTIVNSGWAEFDQIVSALSPAGTTLYARRPGEAEGTLVAYPIGTGGAIAPGTIVGTGWNLQSSLS